MQINTIWLGPLSRYTGLSLDTVRQRLVAEPCFNIAASGAIMRLYLVEANGDVLRAVGNYHSHTPTLHDEYLAKVVTRAGYLFSHSAPQ